MKKGEIYLVPYPYTDFTNFKIRPALVLINFANDVTICYITSQLSGYSGYDILLQPTVLNGLSVPSLIKTGKVTTVTKKKFISRLGVISPNDMQMLDSNLKLILQLE
jgi:mRNA interferase MazF